MAAQVALVEEANSPRDVPGGYGGLEQVLRARQPDLGLEGVRRHARVQSEQAQQVEAAQPDAPGHLSQRDVLGEILLEEGARAPDGRRLPRNLPLPRNGLGTPAQDGADGSE